MVTWGAPCPKDLAVCSSALYATHAASHVDARILLLPYPLTEPLKEFSAAPDQLQGAGQHQYQFPALWASASCNDVISTQFQAQGKPLPNLTLVHNILR